MPQGFWSYARGDDEHLDRRLSELRGRIAGEISILLGREISMFQDIYDIRTGDDWEQALRGKLTDASFLIPVLTPRYFEREWCREELLTYIRLAREAGREPLIFPISFIEDRAARRNKDCEVRAAVGRFQYHDFTRYRFESDPTQREKLVHDFASDVIERVDPDDGDDIDEKFVSSEPTKPASGTLRNEESEPTTKRKGPAPKPVNEVVVDPFPGRGDYSTIAEAIRRSKEGSRIFIRPGRYVENLVLDKALELIGDGPRDEIVVDVSKGNALTCSAAMARISGLTFIRSQVAGKGVAVWVTAGRTEFTDCRFTSASISGVQVRGKGTEPTFRLCEFVGSNQNGLFFAGGSRGIVEDCELTGNSFHGVEIKEVSDPILRRCVLSHNRQTGIFIYDGGKGTIENCTLSNNGTDGLAVKENGNPIIQECSISENTREGIRIEDSTGGGVFKNNDLRGNKRGAWNIAKGAEKSLTRSNNKEN